MRIKMMAMAASTVAAAGLLAGCSSQPSESTMAACKGAWEFDPAAIVQLADSIDAESVKAIAKQVSAADGADNYAPMKQMRVQCVDAGYKPDMAAFLEHEVETKATLMELYYQDMNTYPAPPNGEGWLDEMLDDGTRLQIAYFGSDGGPADLTQTGIDGPVAYKICATTTDGTMVVYSSDAPGFIADGATGKNCDAVDGVWDPAQTTFTVDKSGAH